MISFLKKIIRRILMLFYSPWLRIRKKVIIPLDARISRRTWFEGGNKINRKVSLADSRIGYGTYIGDNTLLDQVKIGRYCSIAANVKVIAATHPVHTFVSTHPAFFSKMKQAGFTYAEEQRYDEFMCYKDKIYVVIGNDVWIGSDAILTGGIKIGDGAIILTGAVVTKDVPPYAIVGGVPAKPIRFRFSESQIEKLLQIKWWNWDARKLQESWRMFGNIDKFLLKIKTEKGK